MERWSGKVAVVTGASSGIGEGICIKLVEAGMKVVGFARRVEKVNELAKKLAGKKGKLHPFKCDVTKEEDILAGFEWIKKNLGPVHIMVNNAGVIREASLIGGATEDFKQVIDTNLLGLCICTREAIKSMQANDIAGHVVHINSVGGHYVPAFPNINVYCATKFGVTALTETLRRELNTLNSKIKVTSISPAYVKTNIMEAAGYQVDEDRKEMLKQAPGLASEDVADAVVYVIGTPPHVMISELTIRAVGDNF